MANLCDYKIKINGSDCYLKQLVQYLKDTNVAPAILSVNVIDKKNSTVIIAGECAWSVNDSMFNSDDKKINLKQLSKSWSLDIEIYSREVCFEEHYVLKKGVLIVEDTEDITCIYNDQTKEEIFDWCFSI